MTVSRMFAGIILSSVLPGEIACALSRSWKVSERMAARILRLDINAVGQRMIVVAPSRTPNNVPAKQAAG